MKVLFVVSCVLIIVSAKTIKNLEEQRQEQTQKQKEICKSCELPVYDPNVGLGRFATKAKKSAVYQYDVAKETKTENIDYRYEVTEKNTYLEDSFDTNTDIQNSTPYPKNVIQEASIVLTEDGVPTETPEVQAARIKHLNALALAKARNSKQNEEDSITKYNKKVKNITKKKKKKVTSIKKKYEEINRPVITADGVPLETPEVQLEENKHFKVHKLVKPNKNKNKVYKTELYDYKQKTTTPQEISYENNFIEYPTAAPNNDVYLESKEYFPKSKDYYESNEYPDVNALFDSLEKDSEKFKFLSNTPHKSKSNLHPKNEYMFDFENEASDTKKNVYNPYDKGDFFSENRNLDYTYSTLHGP